MSTSGSWRFADGGGLAHKAIGRCRAADPALTYEFLDQHLGREFLRARPAGAAEPDDVASIMSTTDWAKEHRERAAGYGQRPSLRGVRDLLSMPIPHARPKDMIYSIVRHSAARNPACSTSILVARPRSSRATWSTCSEHAGLLRGPTVLHRWKLRVSTGSSKPVARCLRDRR